MVQLVDDKYLNLFRRFVNELQAEWSNSLINLCSPLIIINGRQRFHWAMPIFWSRKVHFENPSNPTDNPFIDSTHRHPTGGGRSRTKSGLEEEQQGKKLPISINSHPLEAASPSLYRVGCQGRLLGCCWLACRHRGARKGSRDGILCVSKGTRINWANSGMKV